MSARLKIAALAASLIAGCVAGADSAAAQNDPVIVVPGRAGVPVMMYGVDVSGAVIEGETSLNRPDGAYPPTVIMRYWPPDHYRNPGAYFPATGHKPQYGRREVIPPPDREMPPRAKRFYRDWMIESAPGPVSTPAPYDPAAANGGAANGGGVNGGGVNGGAVNGGGVNGGGVNGGGVNGGGAPFGARQGLPPAAAGQFPMVSPRSRFHPFAPPPHVHPAPLPPHVHAGPPPPRVHPARPRPRVHRAPVPHRP
jgi:hypothetical protein